MLDRLLKHLIFFLLIKHKHSNDLRVVYEKEIFAMYQQFRNSSTNIISKMLYYCIDLCAHVMMRRLNARTCNA